jgi:hypothetical protein
MEIFFGIVYIVVKLIKEHIAEKRANEHADQVVRRYINESRGK